jgi:hypothetical protein
MATSSFDEEVRRRRDASGKDRRMKRALALAVLVAFACGVIATLVVSYGYRLLDTPGRLCVQLGDESKGVEAHVVKPFSGEEGSDPESGCSKGQLCLHQDVGPLLTRADVDDCSPNR